MSAVYWLARWGTVLAGWTPPALRQALGRAAGGASNLAWRSKRQVTRENMAQVTGRSPNDPYVRRLAYTSWVNYGRYASDFLNFANIDAEAIERECSDASVGASWKEYIDQAREAGRGTILASAHFGNWDMAGVIVGRHMRPHAVADTFKDPRLDKLIQSQREAKGVHIIPLEGSARRLLRVLQQNEIVGLVTDRPLPPGEGVEITFFGRKTSVPAGPGTLALKTGAPIVAGFVWYGSDRRFCIRTYPPIFPQKGAARDAEIARLTQYIYTALEEVVRAYPSQWYMFRPFWPAQTALPPLEEQAEKQPAIQESV